MKSVSSLARAGVRLLQTSSSQLVLLLTSLGMLYLAVVFALNSSFSHWIIDRAFNQNFRGNIQWQRLNYGPLPWSIEIVGLTISDENGERVVTLDGLRIGRIELAGLLLGEIAVSDVTLIRPTIQLSPIEAGGPLNIAHVFQTITPDKTPSEPARTMVKVDKIRIVDGHFSLKDSAFETSVEAINTEAARFALTVDPTEGEMSFSFPHLSTKSAQVGVGETTETGRSLAWRVDGLSLTQFAWENDGFRVGHVTGQLLEDKLDINGFRFEQRSGTAPILTLDLALHSSEVGKHLKQFGIIEINGPLVLKLRGRGSVDGFDGSLNLLSDHLRAYEISLETTEIELGVSQSKTFTIKPSSLGVWGGRLDFSGDFSLPEGKGRLDLAMSELQVERMPSMHEALVYNLNRGVCSGKSLITFDNLLSDTRRIDAKSNITINRTDASLPIFSSFELELGATFESNTVDVKTLKMTDANETLWLSGWLNLTDETLSIESRLALKDVQKVLGVWNVPVAGELAVSTSATGKWANPKVLVSLADTRLSYQDVKDVDVVGNAVFENRLLSIRELKMRAGTAAIAISGNVNLKAVEPELDLSLLTENFELALLGQDGKLSGQASLAVDVSGSSVSPKASINGKIRGLCRTVGPKDVLVCLDEVDTRSTVSSDVYKIESFLLRDKTLGLVRASGNGSFKNHTFVGILDLVDFPLEFVDTVLTQPLGLAGRVDADLSVGGRIDHPTAGGKLELQDFVFGDYELGNLTVLLVGNNARTTVQILGLGGQRLILSVPLIESEAPPSAKLILKSFEPQKWLPQLEDIPLTSAMSGKIEASFADMDFSNPAVQMNLTSLNLEYNLDTMGIGVKQTAPISIDYKNRKVLVEKLQLGIATRGYTDGRTTESIETATLNVAGEISDHKDINLALAGDLLLQGLQPFVKGTFSQLKGAGRFKGEVRGTVSTPKPNIDVIIDALALTPRSGVVGMLLELKDQLDFRLIQNEGSDDLGDWLVSRSNGSRGSSVRILRDESLFNLDDLRIELKSFLPNRIRIDGRVADLTVRVPGVLSATINAPELIVEWSVFESQTGVKQPRLLLGGDIRVQEGEFVQDITGVNQINEDVRNRLVGRSAIKRVSVAERFPILKRLYLDLSVSGDGDFFVRNKVTVLALDMEIKLGLEQISGYLYPEPGDSPQDQLKLVGDVTILPDSKLIYARRDFEVSRGIIDFGRGQFMDAELEASRTFTLRSNRNSTGTSTQFDRDSGEVRLEEVNLTARIQQSTRQTEPRISMNLSSNSGASKFDVAMLVLTGSYPEDASGAASAQPAAEVLLAPLLSLVERPLEDTLDIDLSLTPATAGSLFIDIDKMLSRRLRLYSRVFVGDGDDTNPQKFGLEYQINNTVLGEFTSEKTGNYLSTAGRLRLRLELD